MQNPKRYKWFYTKSEKLVVGGKSALQNDELLKELKAIHRDTIIMHTAAPGSPFCAILAPLKAVTAADVSECAVFTGCFSRAWKEGKKSTVVDMFHLSQLKKTAVMKTGTWSVVGKIQHHTVDLRLALTMQDGAVRAVPLQSVPDTDAVAYVAPGNVDKVAAVQKTTIPAVKKLPHEQLIAALPAGGVKFSKK